MLRKTITAAFSTIAAGLITTGPVLAGADQTGPTLPAPGVLGLVAIAVVGAIALARLRK